MRTASRISIRNRIAGLLILAAVTGCLVLFAMALIEEFSIGRKEGARRCQRTPSLNQIVPQQSHAQATEEMP